MQREFHTYRLPNGIRGIHRQVKGNVAHCALVVNAGSRDERSDEYGLAHFAEHAFCKGTQRRRAWQVNCRLENLGGELNAFTTKEDTTIHATTLRGDFAKAAELLADVAFRSTFPDRELEREKEVIYDEINHHGPRMTAANTLTMCWTGAHLLPATGTLIRLPATAAAVRTPAMASFWVDVVSFWFIITSCFS